MMKRTKQTAVHGQAVEPIRMGFITAGSPDEAVTLSYDRWGTCYEFDAIEAN